MLSQRHFLQSQSDKCVKDIDIKMVRRAAKLTERSLYYIKTYTTN